VGGVEQAFLEPHIACHGFCADPLHVRAQKGYARGKIYGIEILRLEMHHAEIMAVPDESFAQGIDVFRKPAHEWQERLAYAAYAQVFVHGHISSGKL